MSFLGRASISTALACATLCTRAEAHAHAAATLIPPTVASTPHAGTATRNGSGPARDGASTGSASSGAVTEIAWDARAAEHLLNRAGFGARTAEIEAAVTMGARAYVERLLTARADVEPYFLDRYSAPTQREMRELPEEEREKIKRDRREADRRQLTGYMVWWFDRMQSGEDPLLEKLVLFWHGFFTTSAQDVKRSYEVLNQNQFVREHALGSYADLLRGMASDAAMLTYLDNQVNRKDNPNENFARELFELFSLGEGNYTENDVKEAARALTGRGTNARGEYEFHRRQHDDGDKTILGVTGKHDGDALVSIILKQPACARHVARRLLAYFEGVEPDAQRLERYARCLRDGRYELIPFLRTLFLDPDFYRAEVVGARVQGPIEYMVGMSRRLDARVAPAILAASTTLLGQRLFSPPSVKGWEEGDAWITTSSLMQRGNLAGLVLGLVDVDDVLSDDPMTMVESGPSSDASMSETSMEGTDSGADERDPKGTRADERKSNGERTRSGRDPAPGARPDEKNARPNAADAAQKKPKANKAGSAAYQALRRVEAAGWAPPIHLTARLSKLGCKTDAQIVDWMLDELLAVPAPHETRERLRVYLTKERASLGLREGRLLEGGADAEHVLRRLAHLILSLPEAQLS